MLVNVDHSYGQTFYNLHQGDHFDSFFNTTTSKEGLTLEIMNIQGAKCRFKKMHREPV